MTRPRVQTCRPRRADSGPTPGGLAEAPAVGRACLPTSVFSHWRADRAALRRDGVPSEGEARVPRPPDEFANGILALPVSRFPGLITPSGGRSEAAPPQGVFGPHPDRRPLVPRRRVSFAEIGQKDLAGRVEAAWWGHSAR